MIPVNAPGPTCLQHATHICSSTPPTFDVVVLCVVSPLDMEDLNLNDLNMQEMNTYARSGNERSED